MLQNVMLDSFMVGGNRKTMAIRLLMQSSSFISKKPIIQCGYDVSLHVKTSNSLENAYIKQLLTGRLVTFVLFSENLLN